MAEFDLSTIRPVQEGPSNEFDLSTIRPVETVEVVPVPAKSVSEEPEYEGALQELGEGILSGVIAIPEGIAGLAANGIDLMADTSFSSDVTEGAKNLRDKLGLDPEGFLGKGSEVITQFVIPGLGVASAVSKASKLGKLARSGEELSKAQRFALGAQQVAAATGADIVVATDGVTTIGDFFEGGPTETNKETGLEGREEALRQLTNRFKVGVETGALVTAAPAVLAGAGAAISKTGDVVGTALAPVVSPVVRAIGESKTLKNTKEFFKDIESNKRLGEEQHFLKDAIAETLGAFRYRGLLPEEIGTARSLISGQGEAEIKEAKNTINALNEAIKVVTKGNSELTRKSILDNLEAFLDPAARGKKSITTKGREKLLDNLPTNIQPIAVKMRGHIDSLSRDVLDSDLINRMKSETSIGVNPGEMLSETIEKNLGTYLRRRYLAMMDPNYKPDEATLEIAINGFRKDKESTLISLKRLNEKQPVEYSFEKLGLSEDGSRLLNNSVTTEQAKLAAKEFLNRHRISNFTDKNVARRAIERIRGGMFAQTKNLREYQRRLLGEIRDPEESYLSTIADLAEFKATDEFFGEIRTLAETNDGIGKLFIAPGKVVPEGYRKLGDEGNLQLGATDGFENFAKADYGSLEGFHVPERIWKDLTKAVTSDHGPLLSTLKAAYTGLIRAKGFTQYGKTVLSPITQIRNVTSAALFALAQGNVGKGANLFESIRLVIDDIKKLTPDAQLKELKELQSLGVVGTQAELQEIRRLINKGTAVSRFSEGGSQVGRGFAEKLSQSRGGDFLLSAGKKIKGFTGRAEDLYQGGDDIWKIYNFKFEQAKLKNALRGMGDEAAGKYVTSKGFNNVDDFIKAEAADIVRNNVPNYNLAPEFIRSLRVLPIGNFIAFPYEIIRTGTNTVTRGLKELASEIPDIQKIGLRRLMGASTTYVGFPMALSELAYSLSGVSEDEIKAYQRSLGAPWEKNARLIPTGRDKDGLPTYINYSYTNPYDMLGGFINGAINKFTEAQSLGKDTSVAVAEAGWEALSELVSPFTEESIAFAALRDVLPTDKFGRGGQTVTGSIIYKDRESLGDKIAKGFTHVVGTMLPTSATPFDVRGGEIQVGRFTRSLVSATGLNDVTGISPLDRQKRERQLAGELVRAFTGVTESTMAPEQGIKFKGYEFSQARRSTAGIFNRIARRGNLNSSDEILDAFNKANEAKFRVSNEFYKNIEDFRTIGMSDRAIKKVLKEAGVGGFKDLMRGKYDPFNIAKFVEKEMRRNDTWNLVPKSEIRAIQREQRRRKFGEVEEPVVAPAQAAAPVAPAQANAPVSPILVPNPVTRATFGSR